VNKIKELEEEVEDLTIHLADMLEAVLYFAGVKEESIEEAVKAYIDALDEVFEDDDGEMGYKEVVVVVEHLKRDKPELFS
jgi:20S proteasome alpha/beta subunit